MKVKLVLLLGLAAVSAFTTGNREDNTEIDYQYYGESAENMESGEWNGEVNFKESGNDRVAEYGSGYSGYGSGYSGYPSYTGYGSGYSGYPSYTGYGSGYSGYPSYTGYGFGYSG